MRAMDGLEQRKEEMRDMRRIHWLTDFVDDVRYAIRSLRRTSGRDRVRGDHARAGHRDDVRALQHGRCADLPALPRAASARRRHPGQHLARQQLRRFLLPRIPGHPQQDQELRRRDRQRRHCRPVGFSAEPGATPRVKGGMLVSGNYFRVLGVEPQPGRGFRDDEDEVPGRDAVVVLGPDFWKHEFASDPAVVGRTIRLNGTDFTVIGVAPETFPGMQIFSRPDFYMPLAMARVFSTNPQKDFFEDRDDRELSVKARLKPGTTRQQAQSELAVLAQDFEREYPALNREPRRGGAHAVRNADAGR